jgi:hypothetical protein
MMLSSQPQIKKQQAMCGTEQNRSNMGTRIGIHLFNQIKDAKGMYTHNFRQILTITTALLLPCLVTSVQASGFYVGAAVGSYNINDGNLDDNDRVIKTLVGYQLIGFLAIEGVWTDFNRVNNGGDRFEADGRGLVAVLSLPMGIFVKGGQFWWDSDAAFSSTAQSSDGNDPLLGVGFKFNFSDNLALRLELERYDVLDTKINTYTAGLDFSF